MTEHPLWMSPWPEVGGIALGAVFFYFYVIAIVRLLGKRSTSQLNNFDWIINIAVGSLAASGILLKDIGIFDAAVAIAVLGILQWLTTWTVLRYKIASRIVKAEPTLLTHKGKFLRKAMRKSRISEAEIYSALRAHGMFDLADASWVVLETNGELTVIPKHEKAFDQVATMRSVRAPDKFKN